MEACGPRHHRATAAVSCLRTAFAFCVVVDGRHLFLRGVLESLDWRRGVGMEQQPAEHDVQQVDGACRLDAQDMYLLYDGNCKLCRRTVASFRVFDLFERVTYVNALDGRALQEHGLNWLDPDALIRDLHVVVGRNTSLGFAAYREWLKR